MVKRAFLCVLAATAILAAGCSDDKPVITSASEASSDAILQRDCETPKWKQRKSRPLVLGLAGKPVNW